MIVAAAMISCKNETKEAVESTEQVVMLEYQCPMKCEGDKTYTEKDTKCPVCGMALKEVAAEAMHTQEMPTEDSEQDEEHDEEMHSEENHDQ